MLEDHGAKKKIADGNTFNASWGPHPKKGVDCTAMGLVMGKPLGGGGGVGSLGGGGAGGGCKTNTTSMAIGVLYMC